MLQPHQLRVIAEKRDLEIKAKALSDFIGNNPMFDKLDPAEQERLKEQNDVMWKYCEILDQRILSFAGSLSDDISTPGLPFSDALALLKSGKRLTRKGWHGQGMFVFLVPGITFKVNRPPLMGIFPEGTEINYLGHIDIKTLNGNIGVWTPSAADLLAEDWGVHGIPQQ